MKVRILTHEEVDAIEAALYTGTADFNVTISRRVAMSLIVTLRAAWSGVEADENGKVTWPEDDGEEEVVKFVDVELGPIKSGADDEVDEDSPDFEVCGGDTG